MDGIGTSDCVFLEELEDVAVGESLFFSHLLLHLFANWWRVDGVVGAILSDVVAIGEDYKLDAVLVVP